MSWSATRLGVVLGTVSFAAFALAAWPGLTGGDSGELISVSHALSTAHPPGYPLYVWLGKAASLVLWGSLAHRYNLFSGLCAAAAIGLFGAAVLRWTRSTAVAVAAALGLGTTSLMLTYATRAEVFALNQALAALVLLLAVQCLEAPSRAAALALGGALGLGLGNHLTLVLVAAPLVFVASKGHRLAAALAASGALAVVYALVPLGAVLGPAQAWGDVLTPAGFFAHVTRADYGSLRLAAAAAGETTPLAPQLGALARSQLEAVAFGGAALAALGVVKGCAKAAPRRPLALALLGGWVLASLVFVALARFPMSSALMESVLERFFLLPQLPLLCFAALGLAALRPRAVAAVCAVVVLGSAVRFALHVRARPPDALPELYASALLDPLPANAVLLVRGDLLSNAVRCAQAAGARPDVVVLDQELLTYPWYVARRGGAVVFPAARWNPGMPGAFALAELLAANPERPFAIAGALKPGDPTAGALGRWPSGLAERLSLAPLDEAAGLARAEVAEAELLASPFASAAALPRADPWEQALDDELWEAQHRLAVVQISSRDAAVLEQGEARLWRLIERRPRPPAEYYRNAAIAAARLGRVEKLAVAVERYLELAPADAPDRATFEAELKRLRP